MASKVDICRRALSLLGQSNTLANIEQPEDDLEIICDRWYDVCREEMLTAFNWTFAKKRQVLALDPEGVLFDYEKSFFLPSDFLQIESIYEGEYVSPEEIDYRIEGRNILYDAEENTLNLVYIANIEQTGLFPAYFTSALEFYLAFKMSNEVNKNDTDIARLEQLFNKAMVNAKAMDSVKRKVYIKDYPSDFTFKTGTRRRYGKNYSAI